MQCLILSMKNAVIFNIQSGLTQKSSESLSHLKNAGN
jgi:hypothetical protein